jgi:hypothetical protein
LHGWEGSFVTENCITRFCTCLYERTVFESEEKFLNTIPIYCKAPFLLGLPGLANFIFFKGISISLKLKDLEGLQLEVDVARRLRLAAIVHIYSVLPYITRHSCSLARTIRSRDNITQKLSAICCDRFIGSVTELSDVAGRAPYGGSLGQKVPMTKIGMHLRKCALRALTQFVWHT